MAKTLTLSDDYKTLIFELKSRVQSAQIKAALKVNEELIQLYWDIGDRESDHYP